jgi:signal transduction histidine kinase
MGMTAQGLLTATLLLVAAGLSHPPSDAVAGSILGLGAIWLEGRGVELNRGYRFTPATPVLLCMALCPSLGSGLVVLVILLDSVYRVEAGFWSNLGQRLSVALALLCVSATEHAVQPVQFPLSYLLGPLVYLVARLGLEGNFRPLGTAEERLVYRQLHLRIRPLEIGLAAVAPLFAAGVTAYPWLALGALPLLAVTPLAAENVLLTANDRSVAQLLKELKATKVQAQKAARERDQAKEEKQILDGFSQHLAGNPTLEATASSLVTTVHKLLKADSVVVFLGQPPEPFSYRVCPEHLEGLQAAALTEVREPIVDRAFQIQKPVLQKALPEVAERLLPHDIVAAALPLGRNGVLYVGRRNGQSFGQPNLDRLKWLAEKAAIVLDAAYQTHEAARQRRQQEQAVTHLQRQVVGLSRLVQGAEEMASSLDATVLAERLIALVVQMIPHRSGQLLLASGQPISWGESIEPHPELLQTARETGRPVAIEDVATSRFGSPGERVSSVLTSPLMAGQQCLGVIVLATDIKRGFQGEQMDLLHILCSQAAMALSHAGLYSQVVEARQQLEESQASLVQSSKLTAIGQLAAGVAHELNSPMGAVSLSVDEAINQLRERPELAARLLAKAQEGVDRARAIIDRLLAYSRKPSHQSQLLSLRSLVNDTVEFLAFQLRAAGVSVTVEAGDPGLVEGEEQPLQQVLANLILNAAQAMEETAPEARQMRMALAKENGHVRLDVADCGSGISAESLNRIFDPFFTTKPVGRGTGLGLWASRQIVLQHGGTLTARSENGRGSTFTVLLPAAAPKDG